MTDKQLTSATAWTTPTSKSPDDLQLTISGGQGAGKSNLAQIVATLLQERGYDVYVMDDDLDAQVRFAGSGPRVDVTVLQDGVPTAESAITDLAALCREIHASNVTAGWWTDLKTGESTLTTRNRPEMLMLAVSEIAEAADGVMGEPDDKLPHLPMYDLELADFVIRLLDQIGAEVSLGAVMPFDARVPHGEYRIGWMKAASRLERLMGLMTFCSDAMENYRRGRLQNYVDAMAQGVRCAFTTAGIEHIDLLDIIAQKRAFNATRADHQVANRVKDGGKQF